jgi:RimJ/RimL family protein N-acetyltransferase
VELRLIEIGRDGKPSEAIVLPPLAHPVCQATVEVYSRSGFVPPWTGYFALQGDQVVGTCAFKSPPQRHRVEIAYYTFPTHERKGIATEMARNLVQIAQQADATIDITARTLPEYGASTAILRKLGFQQFGLVNDPDDGDVWEWRLKPPAAP